MIEFESMVKRYGSVTAVAEVTTTIGPGRVTGLLGPNGAGKTTMMRVLLGLAAPTSGRALVCGREYGRWSRPARVVGAHLDVRGAHPGRRARAHLVAVARASGLPTRRADEVLEEVGLSTAAGRRVGTFSLGMAQRLGIATALLGDPEVLVLDEPVNGLDSDGVRWTRDLLRRRAEQGATVLLSSHLMSETQLTADHIVVVARGRVLADAPLAELTAVRRVRVVCSDRRSASVLRGWFERARHHHEVVDGQLEVRGVSPAEVGEAAAALGVALHLLRPVADDLESAYQRLVETAQEFRAAAPTGALVGGVR